MVRAVRGAVRVPLAVKLSPFYTALGHFTEAGSTRRSGRPRPLQPVLPADIDIEELQVRRAVYLSHSSELPLRLRWLAIISGRVKASLAVSGGVHTVVDVIQSVMTGAHAVQIVSALLQRGPAYLAKLRQELAEWLEEHEYHSLRADAGQHEPRVVSPTRGSTSAPTTC
jgi:dihydroorotate dehydrogenase (fumarate)